MNTSLVKEYFQQKTEKQVQLGDGNDAEIVLQPISTSPLLLIVAVSSSGNSQSTYDKLIDGGRPRFMLCPSEHATINRLM